MANKKITELTALTSAASDDVLAIVDVSGTAETKKITVANLTAGSGGTVVSVKVSIANPAITNMMYSKSPVVLKAAEVGMIIIPVSCLCVANYDLSAESSSFDLRMGWDGASSTTVDYWGSARDWMNGVGSGSNSGIFGGTNSVGSTSITTFSLTNKPFEIWSTGDFNGGWNMDVFFSYYMVTA